MMYRSFLLCVLVCLVGCGSTPDPAPAPVDAPGIDLGDPSTMPAAVRLPLTTRGGYLFVRGQVNGAHAGEMLFDTGSTLTIVDTGLANRLGMPITDRGTTTGIAGRASFDYRAAESIALAGVGIEIDRLASMSMRQFMRGPGISPGGTRTGTSGSSAGATT